jgi:hypothetical protein
MRTASQSGEYGPELVALMASALNDAWRESSSVSKDVELARLVMANAIIEQVDLGVRVHEELVEKATSALAAAVGLSCGGIQTRNAPFNKNHPDR